MEGWDKDFPKVMHFIDLGNTHAKPWTILSAHPDYEAAKNHEDRVSAARLIADILGTPENTAQLQALKLQYPGAIVVPVHAIEENGRNRIPEMLAEYIAKQTGFEADIAIVQTNKVYRTGSNEWHRFAFRPEFDGKVEKERKYILVDDVFSNGGTFNELKCFIEKNRGKVVQVAAISLGGHGDEIAPRPESIKTLLDKFGENRLQSFMKEINLYEGNYKLLTEPEAYALKQPPSLDQARDRILEARQTGRTRTGEEAFRRRETPQVDKPPHSFHW